MSVFCAITKESTRWFPHKVNYSFVFNVSKIYCFISIHKHTKQTVLKSLFGNITQLVIKFASLGKNPKDRIFLRHIIVGLTSH